MDLELGSRAFPLSRQGVAWYHAKEHLYHAVHLAFWEGSAEADRWAKKMEACLYQGQVGQVVVAIKGLAKGHRKVAGPLHKEADYFWRNRRCMQYLALREDGFPIGSGMVESGGKRFRARLAGAGMRWSRAGAERLTSIYIAILSNRLQEL